MSQQTRLQLVPGQVLNGYATNYIVDDFIGSGAFAKVFSVTSSEGKRYALKILCYRSDAMTEANLLLAINDLKPRFAKYICKLTDVIEFGSEDNYGLILEKGTCTLLQTMIANNMLPLSHRHIKEISYQLLCGLESLHQFNICHVDLKPENILIKETTRYFHEWRNDETSHLELFNPEIMICDFNCSRISTRWNKHLDVAQTFHYRAPEVPLGLVPHERIDVFSAGAIMAELVCGQVVFDCENRDVEALNEFDRAHHIRLFERQFGECPIKLLHESPYEIFHSENWREVSNASIADVAYSQWKTYAENQEIGSWDREALGVINTMMTWPDFRNTAKEARSMYFFKNRNKDTENSKRYFGLKEISGIQLMNLIEQREQT